MNYKIFLISNKPHLYDEIQNNMLPEKLDFFDGTDYPSFSKLVNDCVSQCTSEIIIIMSDKVRPTASDIERMLLLIKQGYGFVGMYRLGFFGFKKELMRRIGMFDERYTGGGYEDDDIYIRMKEANISMYLSHEVKYIKSRSSWNYSKARPHYLAKWGSDVKVTKVASRKLDEESYTYKLGESIPTNFLPYDKSLIHVRKLQKYLTFNFE